MKLLCGAFILPVPALVFSVYSEVKTESLQVLLLSSLLFKQWKAKFGYFDLYWHSVLFLRHIPRMQLRWEWIRNISGMQNVGNHHKPTSPQNLFLHNNPNLSSNTSLSRSGCTKKITSKTCNFEVGQGELKGNKKHIICWMLCTSVQYKYEWY